MSRAELKVALVGCGQIADAHLQEIAKVPRAAVVAVCDRQLDLARQAAARFEVPATYDDLGRLLEEVRPDIVHITTPPHSHCGLALQSLEGGAHVLLEKPFTLDTAEADRVFAAATAAGRLVCVGHDQLFDPTWLECRRLVDSGALGRIVHVDSYQGYDMAGPFGRAFATDPDHWLRRLPGGLFQNVMSHALYRITDLAPPGSPQVSAAWFGEEAGGDIPTELRASLLWPGMSGQLLFTSTARPIRRAAKLHGTRGAVEVDLDAQVLRRDWAAKAPGAFGKLEVPLRHFREAAGHSVTSMARFLRSRIHYFAGMRNLFEAFYTAILDGGPPPIPYEVVRRDVAIMDDIFARCRDGQGSNSVGPRLPAPVDVGATDGGGR